MLLLLLAAHDVRNKKANKLNKKVLLIFIKIPLYWGIISGLRG
jgi:hypothetical protein